MGILAHSTAEDAEKSKTVEAGKILVNKISNISG
jgi:hypothetical protein